MPAYAPTMADLLALCGEEPERPATAETLEDVAAFIARLTLLRVR